METQSNFKGIYLLDKLKFEGNVKYDFEQPDKIQAKENYKNSADYELLKKWINTNNENKPPDIYNKNYNYSSTDSFKGTYLLDKLTIGQEVVYDFQDGDKLEAKEDYKNSEDYQLLKKWINDEINDEIKPPPPPFIAADQNDHKIELEGYCFKDNVSNKGYYSWFIPADSDVLDNFDYKNLYKFKNGYMGRGHYLKNIHLENLNYDVDPENMKKYGYMLFVDNSSDNVSYYSLDDGLLESSRLTVQLENYKKLFKEFSQGNSKQNDHIKTLLRDLEIKNEELIDYENKLSVLTEKYNTQHNDLLIKKAEYNIQKAFYEILNKNLATENNAQRSILKDEILKLQEELKEKKTIIEKRQQEIEIIRTELYNLENENNTALQENRELVNGLSLITTEVAAAEEVADAAKIAIVNKDVQIHALEKELDAKKNIALRAEEAEQRAVDQTAVAAKAVAAIEKGEVREKAAIAARQAAEEKLVNAKAAEKAAETARGAAERSAEEARAALQVQTREVGAAAAAAVAAAKGRAEAAEAKAAEEKERAKDMTEKMEQAENEMAKKMSELIENMNVKADKEKEELNKNNITNVQNILKKSQKEWEKKAEQENKAAKEATDAKIKKAIEEKESAEKALEMLKQTIVEKEAEEVAKKEAAVAKAYNDHVERMHKERLAREKNAIEAIANAATHDEFDRAVTWARSVYVDEQDIENAKTKFNAKQKNARQVEEVKEHIVLAETMAKKTVGKKMLKDVAQEADGAMNMLKEALNKANTLGVKDMVKNELDKAEKIVNAAMEVKALKEVNDKLENAHDALINAGQNGMMGVWWESQSKLASAMLEAERVINADTTKANKKIIEREFNDMKQKAEDAKLRATETINELVKFANNVELKNAKSNNSVKSLVDNIKECEKDVYITKDGTTNLNEVRINTEDGIKILNVSDFGVPIDYMKLKDFVEKINAIEEKNRLKSLSPEEKDTLDKEIQLIKRTKDKFERFEKMYKLLGEATQGIVNRTTSSSSSIISSSELKEWVYYKPYSKQYLEFMKKHINPSQIQDNSPETIKQKKFFFDSLTNNSDKNDDSAGNWLGRVPNSKKISIFDDETDNLTNTFNNYSDFINKMKSEDNKEFKKTTSDEYLKVLYQELVQDYVKSLDSLQEASTRDLHVFNDKWSLITNKGYFLERMYYAKLLGIKFPETEPQEKDSINYNLFILNNGYKKLIQDLDYSNSLFQVDKKVSNWHEEWRFEVAQNNQNALIEKYESEESSKHYKASYKVQLKVLKDNKQYWEHRTSGRTKSTEVSNHKSQEPNKNSRSNSVEVTIKTDNNTDDRRNNEEKSMTGSKIRTASGNNSSLPSEISPLDFNTISEDAIEITEKDRDTDQNPEKNKKKLKPAGMLTRIMPTNKLTRAKIKPSKNSEGGSKTKKKLKLKKPKKIERKYKQSLKKKAKSKYSQKNKQIKNKK